VSRARGWGEQVDLGTAPRRGRGADLVFGPLDALRAKLLHALGPLARWLVVDREARVALTMALWIGLALLGASTIPLWMLAIGPLVLGVPHVVGDVRYLVARRGLHLRKEMVILVGGPLLASALEGSVATALLAVFGALLAARTTRSKRGLGLVVVGALVGLAWYFGYWADLAFAHLHNFVAIALWMMWRPRTRPYHWWTLGLYVVAIALLASGAAAPMLEATNGWSWTLTDDPQGLDVHYHAWVLAYGADMETASRVILVFAFAQSMHYLVWVRLVPEDDRGRDTPRTFRASWYALKRDLGPVLLWGAIVAGLAVAVWAIVDLAAARVGYLRMAIFHGQLELVALALLFAEGRPRIRSAREEARGT